MYQDYKHKIFAFYEKRRRMPSYQEIMDLVGFKSRNAVHKLVAKLVEEGVVSKDSAGKLIPNSLFGQIPMLGVVEAGIPTVAEEVYNDTLSLDEYVIENKAESFILEVKGDSMIDAHIEEGDLVVVERKESPKEGDIVIAEVDEGWTMKYYRKDKKGRAYLEPANKKYKPIYPENGMRIAAVVKAVIRKF